MKVVFSPDKNSELLEVIRRFGHQSSAHFIFQEGIHCYHGPNDGRVFYARQSTPVGAVNLIFTRPLCASDDMQSLLENFLATQKIPSVFVCVDKNVADLLNKLGYHINQTGVESTVCLEQFSLHGHPKKQLRHASNFGKRKNCHVKELPWEEVDAHQVKMLSGKWRKTKGVSARELRLITRPPVFGDENEVRKFYCVQGDKILAYVFFDPYFQEGKLKGYCANILRSAPGKESNGALDFTILEAIKKFQTEGVSEISLGIAPLHSIQEEEGERKSIRFLNNFSYKYAGRLYSAKNLAYHKTRYRPEQTPWYLCTKDISLLRLYWGLMFGMNIFGSTK